MRKRKTIEDVKQYLNKHRVTFVDDVSVFPPVDDISIKIKLTCSCGVVFNETPRSLTQKFKKDRILSCGCLRKKWTNDNIDSMIKKRNLNIKRITDCYAIKMPSRTKIMWQCLKCNYIWKTTVNQMSYAKIACVRCNGTLDYTVESFNDKLKDLNRNDIVLVSLKAGSKNKSRRGLFRCIKCNHQWDALIHNIIKFRYGCPPCNDNSATRVYDEQYGMFHSKLEYYFWTEALKKQINPNLIQRHIRYDNNRRITCDFVIPSLKIWIEVSGTKFLKNDKYKKTIDEKRKIIENKREIFYNLYTHNDIISCIDLIKQQLDGKLIYEKKD